MNLKRLLILPLIALLALLSMPAQATSPQINMANAYSHYGGANLALLPDGTIFSVIGVGESDAKGNWDILKASRLKSVSSDGGSTWAVSPLLTYTDTYGIADATLLYTSDGTLFMRYTKFKGYRNPCDAQMVIAKSIDNGQTWAEQAIPTGHVYNAGVQNGIELRDGTLLFPFSWGTESGDEYWCSSVLISTNRGQSWQVGGTIDFTIPQGNGCDEPTIVERLDGSIYCLVRTNLGKLYYSVSNNHGLSWSIPAQTSLVSPNINASLLRLSFVPNRVIVCWNNSPTNRYPLVMAESNNDCIAWASPVTVASVSYNSCMPNMVWLPAQSSILVAWWDNPAEGIDRMRAAKMPIAPIPDPPPEEPPPSPETILLGSLTHFTGTNFIDLGSLPALKSQAQGAIVAWAKPTASGVIMSSGVTSAWFPYLMLTTWGYYGYDLTNEDISSNAMPIDGQYHSLVWQTNGNGSWEFWVDGVQKNLVWLRGSNHGFWWNHYATNNFSIGALHRLTNYGYFTGDMLKVVCRLYMTPTEIQQNYQQMLSEL